MHHTIWRLLKKKPGVTDVRQATGADIRAINKQELLKSEWIVLVGEALVAAGSVVVVIGLIRAFHQLMAEEGS